MTRMIRSTIALSGFGLAVAGLLSLAGCNTQAPGKDKEGAAPTLRVEMIAVHREDLQRVSEATPAELLPYEKTDLFARISGFIKEVKVDYGDPVKEGEELAVLSVPEMEKELEQKEANVTRGEKAVASATAMIAEAEASQARAKANYDRWKSQSDRMDELFRRTIIDAQQRDEALNQLKAAEASVAEVAAKIKSAKAMEEESKANHRVAMADRNQLNAMLKYRTIVAPYKGVVTRRNLHTGAFVSTKSNEMPLLIVMRTDLLRMVVDVSEKDVRWLAKDKKIVVDLDAYPGEKFTWKITRLARVLGAGKKARVEAEIPNADGKFYPGMYGHASVILEEKPHALTVPSNSLGKDKQGDFVWLVVEGKAKQQRVTVGLNDGKKAEIISGLTGDEEVVSNGKEALHDDVPVTAKRIQTDAKK